MNAATMAAGDNSNASHTLKNETLVASMTNIMLMKKASSASTLGEWPESLCADPNGVFTFVEDEKNVFADAPLIFVNPLCSKEIGAAVCERFPPERDIIDLNSFWIFMGHVPGKGFTNLSMKAAGILTRFTLGTFG